MGRGSPLSEKLCGQTIQQFKISQGMITMKLGIFPPTAHNIIKRFGESEKVSEHRRQE